MRDEFEGRPTVPDGAAKRLVSEESLRQLAVNKERLQGAQENLNKVILAMDHPSYVDRAAELWGSQQAWVKTTLGLGVSCALLTIGLMAHFTVVLMFSAVSVLSYLGGGFVLDDHYFANQRSKEGLEQGVLGLTNMLGIVMEALDDACNQLTEEVKRLQEENQKFRAQNQLLENEVQKFTTQNKLLIAESEKFKEENQRYQQENDKFSRGVASLQQANEESTLHLQQVEQEYKELIAVKDTLAGAVSTLSGLIISDTEGREGFQTRLEEFLRDSSKSFVQVAERICAAERKFAQATGEIAQVKGELDLCHKTYGGLLQKHGKQLEKFEGLLNGSARTSEPAAERPTFLPRSRSCSSFFKDNPLHSNTSLNSAKGSNFPRGLRF